MPRFLFVAFVPGSGEIPLMRQETAAEIDVNFNGRRRQVDPSSKMVEWRRRSETRTQDRLEEVYTGDARWPS